eukprot:361985-Chlamydomonas_euryale.AAC.1
MELVRPLPMRRSVPSVADGPGAHPNAASTRGSSACQPTHRASIMKFAMPWPTSPHVMPASEYSPNLTTMHIMRWNAE